MTECGIFWLVTTKTGKSLAANLLAVMICAVFLMSPSLGWAETGNDLSVITPEEAFPTSSDPSFDLAEFAINDNQSTDAQNSPLGEMLSPDDVTPTLRTVLLIGLISLVPAVMVMTTCFARFAIVFGLLRQGLGAQQWLPNQVMLALSLFLTLFVMSPVWSESYETGIKPYAEQTYETPAEKQTAFRSAVTTAVKPVRQFMSNQIAVTGNEAAIDMLLSYQQTNGQTPQAPQYYEDVPFSVLLPAYLLSELKTAFVIGFQIVLPFLVIDLVVASILTGMGLMTTPTVLVSLPFKLLLFVLIDGWTLTVEMLLASVPLG